MNRLLLPLALAASTAACATILDFQEPVDRVTASATVEAGAPETAPATPAPTTTQEETLPKETTLPTTNVEPPPCACVPGAPNGWNGPFVVAGGNKKDPPACIGDYAVEAFVARTGAAAGPAECGCSCGAPAAVDCSVPVASFFDDSKCETGVCHQETSAQTCGGSFTCDNGKLVDAVSFGPSLPSGGACAPNATSHLPDLGFESSIRLCAPAVTVSSCATGVCQPAPSPLFSASNRCVTKTGDLACPSAYPVKQVFHAVSDTRGCSKCECEAPTGVTCSATATVLNNSCKETLTAPVPTACLSIASTTHVSTGPGTPQGGSCLPKGGEPVGAVALGDATTVCCLE